MNKTIVLFILLLAITSMFVFVKTDNIEHIPTYFSYSISNNPEKFNYSTKITDFSFSPLEDFCAEQNMKSYTKYGINNTGCVDDYGKRHHYSVSFKDDSWIIGNKSYKAIWNQPKSI